VDPETSEKSGLIIIMLRNTSWQYGNGFN